MRIGIVAWALFSFKGGREKFGVRLASAMQERGHDCTIFYDGNLLGGSAYPISSGVDTYDLDLGGVETIELARSKIKSQHLDVLCLLISDEKCLWAPFLCRDLNIPILISERTSPMSIETFLWNREERLACLAMADVIHLQLESYIESLPEFLHKKTAIINNPVSIVNSRQQNKNKKDRKQLLCVARLEELQKQISLLIKAFALLAYDFNDWDCVICGQGSNETYLNMIEKLQMQNRIFLQGSVDNVDEYYSQVDLFCLPSLFEGIPNALLEAFSYGLPSVGFANCSGVNELISHGKNGLLASEMTAECLSQSLKILMHDEQLRNSYAGEAKKSIERFDANKIFDQWEELLYETAKAKGSTQLSRIDAIEDETIKATVKEIISRSHPFTRVDDTLKNKRKENLANIFRKKIKVK